MEGQHRCKDLSFPSKTKKTNKMTTKTTGKSYPSSTFQPNTPSHYLMCLIYLLTYRPPETNTNFSHTSRPKTPHHPLPTKAIANDKKRGGGETFFFFFLLFSSFSLDLSSITIHKANKKKKDKTKREHVSNTNTTDKKTRQKKKIVIFFTKKDLNSLYLYFGNFSNFSNIKNNTNIPTVHFGISWTGFHIHLLVSLYSSYISLVLLSITHTTSFFFFQN
jgi:hypothetical protein